jgi:hypothetical protein
MDLQQFLACAILLAGGLALLQIDSALPRRMGIVATWTASALGAYFLTQSIALAGIMLAAWICFPVWEMLFVLRQLRVPRHRELADSSAPREGYDELKELTLELEEAGFARVDECRLVPATHQQYYRIFAGPDDHTQAIVGFVMQGVIGFHFTAFTSLSTDGRRWVTWDYPLTYGLSMPPNFLLYRALHCDDAQELYQAHLDFLEVNEVKTDELTVMSRLPEEARGQLQETLNQQVDYNVSRGFLAPAKGTETESFSYSWRGTLYVAGQVLRDLLM